MKPIDPVTFAATGHSNYWGGLDAFRATTISSGWACISMAITSIDNYAIHCFCFFCAFRMSYVAACNDLSKVF